MCFSPTLPCTLITPKWSNSGCWEVWPGDAWGVLSILGVRWSCPAPGAPLAEYGSGRSALENSTGVNQVSLIHSTPATGYGEALFLSRKRPSFAFSTLLNGAIPHDGGVAVQHRGWSGSARDPVTTPWATCGFAVPCAAMNVSRQRNKRVPSQWLSKEISARSRIYQEL